MSLQDLTIVSGIVLLFVFVLVAWNERRLRKRNGHEIRGSEKKTRHREDSQ